MQNLKRPMAALLLLSATSLTSANPPVESLAGVSDGPSMSWSQAKVAEAGYENHSRVNAAKAGEHTMTLSEEGPGDSAVPLVMDPLSGKILPP